MAAEHRLGRRGLSLAFEFTSAHRGGAGPPLVCLHGFTDTWRTWQLVLPTLERRHDVLALTLPGHAGGPPLPRERTTAALVDALERMLDQAGFATAHIVGNSLGGYLALQLAARGRAESVVALAPAGGWAEGDGSVDETLDHFRDMQEQLTGARAPRRGDRQHAGGPPPRHASDDRELRAHPARAARPPDLRRRRAAMRSRRSSSSRATTDGDLDAERLACPVRVVWGTADRLLGWPSTAARYREAWLPHADWVVLDGVGHCAPAGRPA